MNNRNPITRPFGEPVDIEVLLEIADIDEEDMADAIDWFDENASPEWEGALESEPIANTVPPQNS